MTNYNPHKFDGIRNTTIVDNNITSMYFYHSITFKAGLEFNFRDPMVGQNLKASIFLITNKNVTQYGNWTFPNKYLWDEVYYSQLRLLNSEFLMIGK